MKVSIFRLCQLVIKCIFGANEGRQCLLSKTNPICINTKITVVFHSDQPSVVLIEVLLCKIFKMKVSNFRSSQPNSDNMDSQQQEVTPTLHCQNQVQDKDVNEESGKETPDNEQKKPHQGPSDHQATEHYQEIPLEKLVNDFPCYVTVHQNFNSLAQGLLPHLKTGTDEIKATLIGLEEKCVHNVGNAEAILISLQEKINTNESSSKETLKSNSAVLNGLANLCSDVKTLQQTMEEKSRETQEMERRIFDFVHIFDQKLNSILENMPKRLPVKPWDVETRIILDNILKDATSIMNGKSPDKFQLNSEGINIFIRLFESAGLKLPFKSDCFKAIEHNYQNAERQSTHQWDNIPTRTDGKKVDAKFLDFFLAFMSQYRTYAAWQKLKFAKDAFMGISWKKIPQTKHGRPYTIDDTVNQGIAQVFNQAIKDRTKQESQVCKAAPYLGKICKTWTDCNTIATDHNKNYMTIEELQSGITPSRPQMPPPHVPPPAAYTIPPPQAQFSEPPPPLKRHAGYGVVVGPNSPTNSCQTEYDNETSNLGPAQVGPPPKRARPGGHNNHKSTKDTGHQHRASRWDEGPDS